MTGLRRIGIATAIARFGTEIEVVGPAELVDAFGHLARRLARTAAGPTGGETS
ncbi:hypothetical protein ABZ783_29180 [Micromonospora sp. NPDC047738]|uniref:hypothetical protein n=1 Tax=Micromonospora sp. NPDC047738 TaxID=3155741 RepID=UPI0033D9E234